MLESNIDSGNQKLGSDPSALTYGVSITDECIDWPTTDTLLASMSEQLHDSLVKRQSGAD